MALDGPPRVVALESGEIVETLVIENAIAHEPDPTGEPLLPRGRSARPLFAVSDAEGALRVFTRGPA